MNDMKEMNKYTALKICRIGHNILELHEAWYIFNSYLILFKHSQKKCDYISNQQIYGK